MNNNTNNNMNNNMNKEQILLYTNSLGVNIHIPVLRYHKGAGKKVILTCLNHGDEVIGLEAGLQALENIKNNPNFKGEIVVLTTLNMTGFEQNSRLYQAESNSNVTPQNLNRSFGSKASTMTAMTANKILEWLEKESPDWVLDLHSYSHNSIMHTIIDRPGGSLEDKMINLCVQALTPFYLEYEPEQASQLQLDYSLSNQLCIRNIPALTLELGPVGGFSFNQATLATQFVMNYLYTIYSNISHNQVNGVSDMRSGIIFDNPNNIYNRCSLSNDSQYCGYFRPLVVVGKMYQRGTTIGQVINLYGEIVSDISMPEDGILCVLSQTSYTHPTANIGIYLKKVTKK